MEFAEAVDPYVIPTSGRDKIAHTHSYPIGAESLSRSLVDVPQLRRIILSFTAGRFFSFSGEWAHRHNPAGDVIWSVLRARYRRRGTSLAHQWEYGLKPGHSGPYWWIDIYPVKRNVRNDIRKSLETALPELRAWFITNSSADERLGEAELTFTYNEAEKKISSTATEKLEPKHGW